MNSDMTTLKVSKSTRETFSNAAREAGKSADDFLAFLLEEQLWRDRMKSVRQAMAAPDDEYIAETQLWDTTSSDGLRDM